MAITEGGGALADFAKRPLGYKLGVFGGISVGILVLYWQFLLSPLRKAKDQAEMDNASLVQDGEKLAKDLAEKAKLDARSKELQDDIARNRKALPTGTELPAFFETLNRKVGEAGVEVKSWDYKREIPVLADADPDAQPDKNGSAAPDKSAGFVKVPVEVEITGTFYQIERFFASLAQQDKSSDPNAPKPQERIITVENLVLSDPQVKNRDIILDAKFTASTFRQDDASENAPPPKPAPKAGAGAGAGAGSDAGSGAPSTAPGQVKAKVQGELDDKSQRMENTAAGAGAPVGSGSGVDRVKGGM